jgi:hypothetical protein
MSESDRLKIHTGIRVTGQVQQREVRQSEQEKSDAAVQSEPSGKNGRRIRRSRRQQEGERLTAGEKLLRNTAVACALLLTVMALKNVDQPWSRKASEGIRQAMTMRVDWDETLGRLSFVRALVPDTALVFLNMGQSIDMIRPTEGSVRHEYSAEQPWLEYSCAASQQVCAATDGIVAAVGQGAGGDWIVVLEREDGTQTVYGYLAQVSVKAADTVQQGDVLGRTADTQDSRLYFELREDGQSADPTARMR